MGIKMFIKPKTSPPTPLQASMEGIILLPKQINGNTNTVHAHSGALDVTKRVG
jgi:hypothetical protein